MGEQPIDDDEVVVAQGGPYHLPFGHWYFNKCDKESIQDYDAYRSWLP